MKCVIVITQYFKITSFLLFLITYIHIVKLYQKYALTNLDNLYLNTPNNRNFTKKLPFDSYYIFHIFLISTYILNTNLLICQIIMVLFIIWIQPPLISVRVRLISLLMDYLPSILHLRLCLAPSAWSWYHWQFWGREQAQA